MNKKTRRQVLTERLPKEIAEMAIQRCNEYGKNMNGEDDRVDQPDMVEDETLLGAFQWGFKNNTERLFWRYINAIYFPDCESSYSLL